MDKQTLEQFLEIETKLEQLTGAHNELKQRYDVVDRVIELERRERQSDPVMQRVSAKVHEHGQRLSRMEPQVRRVDKIDSRLRRIETWRDNTRSGLGELSDE